jgi:S1-C subfamily serine protease
VTIPSFADVAARVMPAVVSIRSTEIVKTSDRRRQFGIDPFEFFFPDPTDPNRRRFGNQGDEEDEQAQRSGGSGFIVSRDGYIVTNNHVIEGATKVEVHYGADENGNGGRTVTAKIIGRDPATDLALLKIDADQQLPSIRLGDSDRIRKGDWAIAIGHPFTFENTLTVGVISAKGRSLGLSRETQSFENFIQTDAAINFGNSGGPLLNIAGEVIGINTAIRGGGAQGIGFATPVNTAKTLLPQLKQGKVVRGYLGMSIGDVTEDPQAFNLPGRGALACSRSTGQARRQGRHPAWRRRHRCRRQADPQQPRAYRLHLLPPVGTEVNRRARNGQRMVLGARHSVPSGCCGGRGDAHDRAGPRRSGLTVQNLTPDLRRLQPAGGPQRRPRHRREERLPAGEANMNEGDVISEVQASAWRTWTVPRDHRQGPQRPALRMYVSTPTAREVVSGYRLLQAP